MDRLNRMLQAAQGMGMGGAGPGGVSISSSFCLIAPVIAPLWAAEVALLVVEVAINGRLY